jgi:ATP-dependent DNA ligase
LPKESSVISEALAVRRRGRELFELMRAHDLEGVVGKRVVDPYDSRAKWSRIKNPDSSQMEGRGELFNQPPRRSGEGP